MLNWILGGLAVLFLTLWLSARKKKSSSKEEMNSKLNLAEQSLIAAQDQINSTRNHNRALQEELSQTREQLAEKQRELIRVTSELRECLANSSVRPDSTEVVVEAIDKEASADNGERLPFFEVFTDKSGHFRWSFKAKNNKIVADSGEGYTTKQNLKKGMRTFMDAILTGQFNTKYKK